MLIGCSSELIRREGHTVIKLTKLERTILEAIKTAPLGLPDWHALSKAEHIALDYIQQRVEWMRRAGIIK
ncbi:hypothetical protein [Candidatus Roseilinea sp. NK_OTU-006]|uniref:hypothetical protein n=1 Tax=Candidatus Roseilinea sp. NK_OTU-006 TaxID=2704250 RepID=UPI00145EB6D3|nr:hypothetical protein [Candidatus Roseilinea sp. NK_OTU-006]